MQSERLTVGVLHLGEMGASLASVLRAGVAAPIRVITTLVDRGEATFRRAGDAGVEVLGSLADVFRQADVVISLVPPSAAEDLAIAYCELAHLAPAGGAYIDMNSISPEQATAIGRRIEAARRSFVDGAINGLAKNLTTSGTIFLSGGRAGEVASLFESRARVRVLGDQAGKASAMKMLLAGLSKGVCALYAELALVANERQMLPEMIEATRAIYPGIAQLVDRMLPTYMQHAARRATEMRELESTAQSAGIEPCVVAAVHEFHEILAAALSDASANELTVESFVQQLGRERVLAAEPSLIESKSV